MRRKIRRADGTETCAYCRQQMRRGDALVRGITREPYHKACRFVSSVTPRPAPMRVDSPIRLDPAMPPCGTCGQDTSPTDPTRHGIRTHRECLI